MLSTNWGVLLVTIETKGLPQNLDAEKLVLGSILIDDTRISEAPQLRPEDFSIAKHRIIFRCMLDMHERSEPIDRVTLANNLINSGQLQSCDGLTYLVSLDEGLPRLVNFNSYLGIICEMSARRSIVFAAHRAIELATMGDQNASEISKSLNDGLFGIGLPAGDHDLESAFDLIARTGLLSVRGAEDGKAILTRFPGLDDLTGGFRPGELIVIAGRPSMGKSAIGLDIAQDAALKQKRSVAIFSLEMDKESMKHRLLASMARVCLKRYRSNELNEEERARVRSAAQRLEAVQLYIDDSHALRAADIHSKLRRMRAEHGLHLVIIDYLQIMNIESKRKNSRRDEDMGDTIRYVKQMIARELGLPVILLAQLNWECERRPGDHRPILSDLRDTGASEQDADLVCFAYREEYYKPDRPELRGLAELIVAKQRNGPIGTVDLIFVKESVTFETRAPRR